MVYFFLLILLLLLLWTRHTEENDAYQDIAVINGKLVYKNTDGWSVYIEFTNALRYM